ncbi:unnamed protein product [Caenorhabditis auriculariae]|uniref:Ubiquitin-like domain-containing protein n=1 Tax=Caenorhabditis auriculariae TaxID=2777116 RepID=A0A8S1H4U6_9PELO|nr:unnamed protein product [Caenorhabditis auriculariae]
MQVFAKNEDGDVIALVFSPSDSVADVSLAIQHAVGYSSDRQRLLTVTRDEPSHSELGPTNDLTIQYDKESDGELRSAVKTHNGGILRIEVKPNPSDDVLTIKASVELEDSFEEASYNLRKNPRYTEVIEAVERARAAEENDHKFSFSYSKMMTMYVNVKTMLGRMFPVRCEGKETVLQLKERISTIEQISVPSQRLLLPEINIAELPNDSTLESLQIKQGDVILLIYLHSPIS